MSIDYDNEFGIVTFTCDYKGCQEEFIHDDGSCRCNPKEAAKEARVEGWRVDFNKAANDWEHLSRL